jgi:hypothetical protein
MLKQTVVNLHYKICVGREGVYLYPLNWRIYTVKSQLLTNDEFLKRQLIANEPLIYSCIFLYKYNLIWWTLSNWQTDIPN